MAALAFAVFDTATWSINRAPISVGRRQSTRAERAGTERSSGQRGPQEWTRVGTHTDYGGAEWHATVGRLTDSCAKYEK